MKMLQEVLSGSPLFTVLAADVPKEDREFGLHAHTHRYWELKIDVKKPDGSPVRVHMVAPNVVHYESGCQLTVGYNLTTLFLGMEFPGKTANLDIALAPQESNRLDELSRPLLSMPEEPRYETMRNHVGSAVLENLVLLLEDYFTASEKSASIPVIKAAEAYLERNYYRPDLSIVELAEFLGISQQHLNKIFKESYGVSLRQWLIVIRLNRAKAMLETNRYLIKDVAAMTGHRNAFYFCNAFKKYFGYPPRRLISRTPGRLNDTRLLFKTAENPPPQE